eukprot:scaffold113516_cov31-Tisochrysis_lutea.AAC.2
MARGGPRADNRGGAPDWLGKRGESEMQQMQEPRQERRRRRGRDDDDDGDDDPKAKKGGIKARFRLSRCALPLLLAPASHPAARLYHCLVYPMMHLHSPPPSRSLLF